MSNRSKQTVKQRLAGYYDAEAGRFTSFDPILHPASGSSKLPSFAQTINFPSFDSLKLKSQNLNPYIYVIDNPINHVDPYELFWFFDCARNVVSREGGRFPKGTIDKYKHCVVSCKINLECGFLDAVVAGIGKEIIDIFGPGDAELADLIADFRGIQCAKEVNGGNCCDCETCCKSKYH